eukprot:9482788-Pyramimonas_sp.AAC.1
MSSPAEPSGMRHTVSGMPPCVASAQENEGTLLSPGVQDFVAVILARQQHQLFAETVGMSIVGMSLNEMRSIRRGMQTDFH